MIDEETGGAPGRRGRSCSQWPVALAAVAQRAPQPAAAGDMITFDQYRDFRAAGPAAAPGAARASKRPTPGVFRCGEGERQRRKAYYDRVAAMPAEERDQLFANDSTRDRQQSRWQARSGGTGRVAREAAGILRQQSAERAGPADTNIDRGRLIPIEA